MILILFGFTAFLFIIQIRREWVLPLFLVTIYILPFFTTYTNILPKSLNLIYFPVTYYIALLFIYKRRKVHNQNILSLLLILLTLSILVNLKNIEYSSAILSLIRIILVIAAIISIRYFSIYYSNNELFKSLFVISLIQVPLSVVEFYFFKIPGLYQVDTASGTFGYSMHGPLAFFQIIMIVLISRSQLYWVIKHRILIILSLGISVMFTFSGGAMLALLLISPFIHTGSFQKKLKTIIGGSFLIYIIFLGSGLIAQKFGTSASNNNLINYSIDRVKASFNVFNDGNKYYDSRSRAYAMRNAFEYVSEDGLRLFLGEGIGLLTSSFALERDSYLESQLFPTKPVINTPSYYIIEYGFIFLILISFYILKKITSKLKSSDQSLLIILFMTYYFYYNIFHHHQVLIAFLFAQRILLKDNNIHNEIYDYNTI